MAKIVDPDGLAQTTDVVINTTTKKIQIITTGNVSNASPGSTSGVTLQAVYSFLKEEWKTDAALNKFKFPIKMFTKTDGILINGWDWTDATTRNVIRDAGWEEITGDKYAGIVSLGNFDASTDQATYQNIIGYNQSVTNFNKTGNLNEAIMIYNATGPVDYTGYLKLFLRIASGSGTGKLYAEYNLLTEQSISALEPVLYKLPLSNSTDLKITIADATLDAASPPYNGMKINYLKGKGFTTYANSTVYPAASVVKDDTGRWFFTAAGGTSNGATRATDIGVTDWVAYDGEVQIGSNYYAFNRLLTANNGTDTQIYNWAQRQLRKTTDINANDSTTVNQRSGLVEKGNVAELLLEYVGDTLKTKGGLYISGFNTNSTNSIKFRDITVDGGGVNANTGLPVTSTERAFPFVAAGNMNFSSNLVSEPDADTKYTMYFTTNPGGNFDSSSAIIVKNNSSADITGQITASSIAFDFDYDNNVQGGRTAGTDAGVTIVAQGLNGATWVMATYTITRATGQTITVNADDERNYSNPT
ncbi:MAG: hypothetical protein PHE48_04280 [Candidatus Daviesbacteria bacterium]|nr:hypothetical protein [Candidatus Daviesbacteria bacterium]